MYVRMIFFNQKYRDQGRIFFFFLHEMRLPDVEFPFGRISIAST